MYNSFDEFDDGLDEVYNFDEIEDALDDLNNAYDFDEIESALDGAYSFDEIDDGLDEAYNFDEIEDTLDDAYYFDDYEIEDALDDVYDFDEIEDVLDEVYSLGIRERNRGKQSIPNTQGEIPKFEPKYLKGHGERERAINAMIEIQALWKYVTVKAKQNYSSMYSKLSIPISDELKRECQRHKQNFAVYDTITSKWLIKSNVPKYEYCYDGEDFKEFKFAVKSIRTNKRFLLVGKYTILKQEENLLLKTSPGSSKFSAFSLPVLKLIVGVPGCGKTTHIIKNHRPGSLVLTSCAEGAKDMRTRMAKVKHSRDPDEFRGSYRTIDSYLLHSRVAYGTVWVDEALMEHPGKLFLVCLFSRCRTMYMIGDPNQLGFINRVEGVTLLYDKSSSFFKPTEMLNTSYRCPVDVMAVLSNKYDGGAYSTSETTLSMQCQKFTGLEYVPKSKTIKYLVFKQAEKLLMQKANYDVSTIHEFQGKEAEHVVIVRMSRNPKEALYKSLPHMLVGISRHKKSLVYYTPVTDDLKKLIETPLTPKEPKKIKKIAK